MSNTMPVVSPRNRPLMKPRMVRATDQEYDAFVAATEIRGEFVAEATRRLWAEYVVQTQTDPQYEAARAADALASLRLAEVLAMPDDKEQQR